MPKVMTGETLGEGWVEFARRSNRPHPPAISWVGRLQEVDAVAEEQVDSSLVL